MKGGTIPARKIKGEMELKPLYTLALHYQKNSSNKVKINLVHPGHVTLSEAIFSSSSLPGKNCPPSLLQK